MATKTVRLKKIYQKINWNLKDDEKTFYNRDIGEESVQNSKNGGKNC